MTYSKLLTEKCLIKNILQSLGKQQGKMLSSNREKCYPPGLVAVESFTTLDLKGQDREWLLKSHLTYR